MKTGMARVPWGGLQPSLSLPMSPSGSHGQNQPHGLEIYEVLFSNLEFVVSERLLSRSKKWWRAERPSLLWARRRRKEMEGG